MLLFLEVKNCLRLKLCEFKTITLLQCKCHNSKHGCKHAWFPCLRIACCLVMVILGRYHTVFLCLFKSVLLLLLDFLHQILSKREHVMWVSIKCCMVCRQDFEVWQTGHYANNNAPKIQKKMSPLSITWRMISHACFF